MSVFSQDISIGASFDGTPASLGASPGRGGGFGGGVPIRTGALGSPIRAPGSNNIVPLKGIPGRGGALGSPIRSTPALPGSPALPGRATLPGRGVNLPRGQTPGEVASRPRFPVDRIFPRIPLRELPGNPFARSPKPFEPSGADYLPPITYPGQLPGWADGPGIVENPPTPGGYNFQPGFTYIPRIFRGDGVFLRNSGALNFSALPVTTSAQNINGQWALIFTRADGTSAGSEAFLGWVGFVGPPYVGSWIKQSDGSAVGFLPPTAETYQPKAPPNSPLFKPRPLPSAVPTGRPSRAPRPWPQREPSPAPGQQPNPYVSPAPAPMQPGTSPLPEELRPPAPAPAPAKVTDPAGNPISLPSGTPQDGSSAIGAPSRAGRRLGQGVKIQPISIPVPVFTPVNPARSTAPATVPVRITVGQPQPVITPITNYSTTNGPTPALEFLPQPIPIKPPTKPGDCEPDPAAKCRYDNLDIAGKCENIIEKLGKDYSLAWDLPECDQDFTAIRAGNNSGKGLDGIAKQIETIYAAIKVLHDGTRCIGDGDKNLAIPESWNIKRSIYIDQMVIVTKLVGNNTSYRRSFTVPHPRYKTMKSAARIKRFAYKRGSAQATINLRDNSSCVLNCSTIAEAKRVVRYILQLIQPTWAKDARVNYTEKINMYIQPTKVELHKAQYFSSTDNRILPDWSINLR